MEVIIDKMRKLKPHLPIIVIDILVFIYFRIYMKGLCLFLNIREKGRYPDMPSASLRYRVNGSPDMDDFMSEGKKCRSDIESALKRVNFSIDSFHTVLDFGCGCGRTIRWFSEYSDRMQLYGCDIDQEAIRYCKSCLSNFVFNVNGPMPPLDYPDEKFDLVYSISVFTHINEDQQFEWLRELRRVTKKNGLVLLSFHGAFCWENLNDKDKAIINNKGFLYVKDNIWKGIFPGWYQTSYHKEDYIREHYSKQFKILDYIPRGIRGLQDVVIMQKQ